MNSCLAGRWLLDFEPQPYAGLSQTYTRLDPSITLLKKTAVIVKVQHGSRRALSGRWSIPFVYEFLKARKCIVNTLPNETILHILRDVCDDAIPSRKIALVCKLWHSLLQGCSDFWRHVDVRTIWPHKIAQDAERFLRRLEHSKQTLLDVSINIGDTVRDVKDFVSYNDEVHTNEKDVDEEECDEEYEAVEKLAQTAAAFAKERDTYALFKILCTIDVSRWRSLRIPFYYKKVSPNSEPWTHLESLKGRLCSLKELEIMDHRNMPPQGRLYSLLMESQGAITTLRTANGVPDCLMNHAFLKNVSKLVQSGMDPSIGEQWLGAWTPYKEIRRPLPPHLLMGSLNKAGLHKLDLSAVRHLEMASPRDTTMVLLENPIHLPFLTHLTFHDTLSDIKFLKAPQLQELKVLPTAYSATWFRPKQLKEEVARVNRLFKEEAHEITMDPTSLTIGSAISYQALTNVVKHWSKLKDLTIDLSENELLSWNSVFAKAFIKAKQPICPELEVLTLKTIWSTEDSDEWSETVKTMFKQPIRYGKLRKVSWTQGFGQGYTTVHLRGEDESFPLPIHWS